MKIMQNYLIFITVIIISGCAKDELATPVSLRIPLLSECTDTIEKAKNHFKESSANHPYKLDILIEPFESTHHHYKGPAGMATLVSIGEWNTLDGGSPLDYLKTTANGIFADCAPTSSFTLKLEDNPDMSVKDLSLIVHDKGVNYIHISKESVTITFNDGSYEYPL